MNKKMVMGVLLASLLGCQTSMEALPVSAIEEGIQENQTAVNNGINDVTMEGQTLGLTGVQNARELGGYVTESGRAIKKGILLRSGKLENATEADRKKLIDEYHLKTVIDFRTATEIQSAPNPVIEGIENVEIRVLDENSESGTRTTAVLKNGNTDPIDYVMKAVEAGLVSREMYVKIADSEAGKKGLAEFFRILLDNREGETILFHCTSGKDRTGVAAALVLSALGVDEETILEDFELTNEFLADQIAYVSAEVRKRTDDPEMIDTVIATTGVDREFMEILLNHLKDTYGSVSEYITRELGVSEEELEILREIYLES